MLVDASGNPTAAPVPGSSGAKPQAMLNRKVEELQKQIETLTAQLKEQAVQIQKVSAQVEASKSAPQVVVNRP